MQFNVWWDGVDGIDIYLKTKSSSWTDLIATEDNGRADSVIVYICEG